MNGLWFLLVVLGAFLLVEWHRLNEEIADIDSQAEDEA